ncbi:hypothetical protein OGR47_21055 (plasmid) [Methylocystis sp. MJC1]|uniref:hypothetical protein n=1 Tax=Methylocystis sp. MJC1 TaxID=2654282 RepID=UPI0013EB2CF7|nr:hypothetical protein [Methylocystis sp. MJC1]MBU6529384.1 hypothetical protein [Methylocystis sp. MJC1]UZX14121.1 hypothetical protein OGR47_21055 [Methylocystis sp. MJC1]
MDAKQTNAARVRLVDYWRPGQRLALQDYGRVCGAAFCRQLPLDNPDEFSDFTDKARRDGPSCDVGRPNREKANTAGRDNDDRVTPRHGNLRRHNRDS